jgi:hypothetical protein
MLREWLGILDWHLYACRYDYPDGSFTLSVNELAGSAQWAGGSG